MVNILPLVKKYLPDFNKDPVTYLIGKVVTINDFLFISSNFDYLRIYLPKRFILNGPLEHLVNGKNLSPVFKDDLESRLNVV